MAINLNVAMAPKDSTFQVRINSEIKKAVEEKSGLKVIGVNVHIQGVKTDINDTQDIIIDEKNEEK